VGVGKERGGVLAVGAREDQHARVPAAGKVLEGDDQRTLSPLYYDVCLSVCLCLCVCVAPGSAPVNIEARPLSGSTVVVQWNEPVIPNGIIQVSAAAVTAILSSVLSVDSVVSK